jgi:hypothetical protein
MDTKGSPINDVTLWGVSKDFVTTVLMPQLLERDDGEGGVKNYPNLHDVIYG